MLISKTSVREIELRDIGLIADYWENCSPKNLNDMGVDVNKVPNRDYFLDALEVQIQSDYKNKESYTVIWEVDDKAIGHSYINDIEFGIIARMHLHIWNPLFRKQGIGADLIKKSISLYFKHFNLKKIICEPYALNPAPNRTVEKLGFQFVKRHRTITGPMNFEQEVNLWEITSELFKNG